MQLHDGGPTRLTEARPAIFELLREFNLSRREADVYLGLLRFEPSSARTTSATPSDKQSDTYRIGTSLTAGSRIGSLGAPAVYEAANPRSVVKSMLTEVEQKARKMKNLAPELVLELEAVEQLPSRPGNPPAQEFKLLKGPAVWRKFEQMVDASRREVGPDGRLPV